MDVKRIQYTQNIIMNKIRLEKELEALNMILDEMAEACDHLAVKVSDGPVSSNRCLLCAAKLKPDELESLTIDACSYKEEEYHKGLTAAEKLGRLNDLRNRAIECLLVKPDMTREELITTLNKQLSTPKKVKEKRG